jgi:hypothetical protein
MVVLPAASRTVARTTYAPAGAEPGDHVPPSPVRPAAGAVVDVQTTLPVPSRMS